MAGSSRKVALITGATGQDGAYLAEFLLSKGYLVHGVKRRSSSFNTERIDHLIHDPHEEGVSFHLHYGDVTDATTIIRIVQETQPDEIYNLAAQSHVQVSFETPEYTANADGLGTLRLLEAIRILGRENQDSLLSSLDLRAVRQGAGDPAKGNDVVLSSLALRGGKALCLLDHGQLPRGLWHACLERHPFQPRESNPRRNLRHPQDHARDRIDRGLQQKLFLGNLDVLRDWGHARDFVGGMWLILQQDTPDDYVLATGENHSVREFVEKAFSHVGKTIVWCGSGVEEKGVDKSTGEVLIEVDPRYFRPTEVDALLGDPSKARAKLGWRHKTRFDELVAEMMQAGMVTVRHERERHNRYGGVRYCEKSM